LAVVLPAAATFITACGAVDAMSGKTAAAQAAVGRQTEGSVRQALVTSATGGSVVETLPLLNGSRRRYDGKMVVHVFKYANKAPDGGTEVSSNVYEVNEALHSATTTCQPDAAAVTVVELGSETKVDRVEFTDPNAPECLAAKYVIPEDADPDLP